MAIKRTIAIGAVMLLALAGCSTTTSEDGGGPATDTSTAPGAIEVVRVNVPGHLSDAPILIAEAKGYFADLGIELEHSRSSAPASIPLLASDQLDVSGGAVGAGFYNSVANEVNVKIVADKGSLNPGTPDYQALVVAPDFIGSTVEETIQNLRGENIGLNSTASAIEMAVGAYLGEGGVSLSEVTLTPMDGPSQLTALTNGAVAAVDALEPALTQMLEAGVGEVVLTPSEVGLQDWQVATLMFGQAFAEKQDLATRFMIGYLQGARDYHQAFFGNDENVRSEVIGILTETTSIKNAELFEKFRFPFIDPNGDVSVASLEAQQDFYLEANHMATKPDLADIVDTSFAEAAVAELGGRVQ